MKRLQGYLRLVILLPLFLPVSVFAATESSGVVIVEVQTAGASSSDEEFVEIYNSSDNIIQLDGWKLQYLSAGGTSWLTKTTLSGYFMPKSRILLASSNYLIDSSDFTFNSGFKLDSGHVRIVSPDPADDTKTVVEDLVGWGNALYPETSSATYAPAGQSITRKIDSHDYIDSDNNSNDFEVAAVPSPESANFVPANIADLVPSEEAPVEEEEVLVESEQQAETVELLDQSSLSPPIITELLPNPAPPETDSDDEYIEIYNPNSQPFSLHKYQLQTGNNFTYDYTFEDDTIGGHEYIVLYSSKTGLSLSNTSSRARLVDPYGNTVSEVDQYEKAKDGVAWSFVDGTWRWNTKPTAGESNVLVAPVSSTKKKSAKSKKPKTKKPEVAAAVDAKTTSSDSSGGTQINKWVIAGVGAIALGYAIYEYKDDIRNKLFQFRRNRALGRSTGPST